MEAHQLFAEPLTSQSSKSELGPDPGLLCTLHQAGQAGFLVGLEVPARLKLADHPPTAHTSQLC